MFERFGPLVRVNLAALRGKSFCWLNKADRDRSAHELDDGNFIKWGRWATSIVEKAWAKEADKKGKDFDEILVMHSVIALARTVLRSDKVRMTATVNGCTYQGQDLGDWRVIIERVESGKGAVDLDALDAWLFNLHLELLNKPDVEFAVGGAVLSIQSLYDLLVALSPNIEGPAPLPVSFSEMSEHFQEQGALEAVGIIDPRDAVNAELTRALRGALLTMDLARERMAAFARDNIGIRHGACPKYGEQELRDQISRVQATLAKLEGKANG